MLKKANRGLQRGDFKEMLEGGKTIQTPLFGVRYRLDKTGARCGWIISKKISPKAVDRNKIKRRLAEVIGKKMIENVDIIILVKKNILSAKIEEIDACWTMVREKLQTSSLKL